MFAKVAISATALASAIGRKETTAKQRKKSIMETDMTREEAIKELRGFIGQLTEGCQEAIKVLIPELAESEDERIRKALVWHLKADVDFVSNGVTKAECIAYLEKLKENPKSADSISSDCASDVKCEDRWHKVTDSLPDNGRLVLANDCLGNTLLARYDGEGNWEVNVYDNEDYYCRNTITKWCEIPSEKQKEQKPAERSLEDDHIIGFVYDLLNEIEWKDSWAMSKDECLRLLNNYSPQKPAEWSEEDENAIITAIDWLEYYRDTFVVTGDAQDEINDCVKRLKSLRPQPHTVSIKNANKFAELEYERGVKDGIQSEKSRQWKPSEEQMEALKKVFYNRPIGSVELSEIESLYNDLKKLI